MTQSNENDLDPQDVIDAPDYVAPVDDPTADEVIDDEHPDYVEAVTL